MRPDLVLDEDDKRKRFKKLHEPTEGSSNVIEIDNDNFSADIEDEDDEIQIVQDFHPNKRVASVALNKNERVNKKQNTRKKEKKETKEYHSSNTSSSLQSLRVVRKDVAEECPSTPKKHLGIFPWNHDESSESEVEDSCFPFPTEEISDDSDDSPQNVSILDPETGLVQEAIVSQSTCAMEENDLVETVEDYVSPLTKEVLKKKVSSLSQDDQIRKYIHKKFRNHKQSGKNSHYLDENHSIKMITIYHENDAGTSIQNKQCDEGQQPVVPIR